MPELKEISVSSGAKNYLSLTRGEERACLERLASCSDRAASRKLENEFLGFYVDLARNVALSNICFFSNRDFDALFSESLAGVFEAWIGFEPARGLRFSTIAGKLAEGRLKSLVRASTRPYPVYGRTGRRRLIPVASTPPSNRSFVYLGTGVCDGGETWHSAGDESGAQSPPELVGKEDSMALVRKLVTSGIDSLSEKRRDVIYRLYGEISVFSNNLAQTREVSGQAVRYLHAKALKELASHSDIRKAGEMLGLKVA